MVKVYYYTTKKALENILKTGNRWYSKGRYDHSIKKFYFTDLPPETIDSKLQRSIFGSGKNITADGTQKAVRTQAFCELEVDGRQLRDTPREHVKFIPKDSPNLRFRIKKCGFRKGWQKWHTPSVEEFDFAPYKEALAQKGRKRGKTFFLKGIKKKL